MKNDEILRHARRAVDELRAGRQTKLPSMTIANSMRVVAGPLLVCSSRTFDFREFTAARFI